MFVNSGFSELGISNFRLLLHPITLVPYSVGLLENDGATHIYRLKSPYYKYTKFRLTSRLWTSIALSSTQTRACRCLLIKVNLVATHRNSIDNIFPRI